MLGSFCKDTINEIEINESSWIFPGSISFKMLASLSKGDAIGIISEVCTFLS